MSAVTADLTQLALGFAYASQQGAILAASETIRDSAYQVRDRAQALAPFKRGVLRNSITVHFPDPMHAVIGPSVKYGVYQEFGTGTRGEFGGAVYIIKPVRAKTLVFKTKDGQWVSTKEVHHPGIPAHPYMRPAAKEVLDTMSKTLAERAATLLVKGKKA